MEKFHLLRSVRRVAERIRGARGKINLVPRAFYLLSRPFLPTWEVKCPGYEVGGKIISGAPMTSLFKKDLKAGE